MLAVASALLLAVLPPAPYIQSGPAEGSKQTRSTATFTFRVIGRDGYPFECRVGGPSAPYTACNGNGSHTVTGLTVGTHTFSVRTYENDDSSESVSRTWTVTAIDDDGDGSAVSTDCNDGNPAIYPGATELAGNGVDENCDGIDAPTVIAAPTPVPTPAPIPAPDVKPKLDVSLSYFMRATKRSTRFSTLSLKDVPAGATITVKCTGGCPRKRATITGKRGTVALTAFRNRTLKAGAKLTIEVTKPGTIGTAKVVTIRARKRPTIVTRTLR